MDNNEHTTLPLLARMHVCNPRATVIWCTFFNRLIQVEERRNCFNNVPVNVPLPSDPYRSLTVPVSRHWTPGCSADRRRNTAQTSALSSKCPIRQFEVHKCPGAASLPHCPQRSEVTTQWLTSSGNLGWILRSNRNSRWWYSLGSTVGPFSRDLFLEDHPIPKTKAISNGLKIGPVKKRGPDRSFHVFHGACVTLNQWNSLCYHAIAWIRAFLAFCDCTQVVFTFSRVFPKTQISRRQKNIIYFQTFAYGQKFERAPYVFW